MARSGGPGPGRSSRPGLEQVVTVHQLRLLAAVADRGGVSRAAESLGLSQPAVSHQLRTLSEAVGAPLVETIGRRVHLTAAGQVLCDHARRILAEFEAAGGALDELRGLRSGMLRVVGDTTVGTYVLPDVLGLFHHEHPAIEVRLDVGNRRHVLARLVANEVDFAIGGRLWEDPPIPLVVLPFLANELIAIASPRHPLAGAPRVTLGQLAGEPFIAREPGSGTRETAEEAFRRARLSVRPVMELASNGAIKRAVAQDLGCSIVSRHAAALELSLGLLVELRVDGFPLRREWRLFHARDKRLSPAAEAFLGFVGEGRWRDSVGRPLVTD
jgi:LysR family transcriptional regulator, low CO2-responsive transcriptional regulator